MTTVEKIKIKNSRIILGLSPNKKYTLDELKKKYRFEALKHHPDKHFNSDESNAKFKEINEAYVYLNDKYNIDMDDTINKKNERNNNSDNDNDFCYSELFSNFINSLMKDFSNKKMTELNIIIHALMNKCATLTSSMFDNMDKESLLFMYNLIVKYYTILDIGDDRISCIIKLIKIKLQMNDVIIIHPTISELFDVNNIQVVEHDNKTYYVPLWHTELYYSIHKQNDNLNESNLNEPNLNEPNLNEPNLNEPNLNEPNLNEDDEREEKARERELIVKCIPKLPEYIYIDEANNIYIDVRTRVENVFNQAKLTVSITDSVSFDVPIHDLEFKTSQIITLKKCGVPMINTENIYDVSEKMNIIIHLEIVL